MFKFITYLRSNPYSFFDPSYFVRPKSFFLKYLSSNAANSSLFKTHDSLQHFSRKKFDYIDEDIEEGYILEAPHNLESVAMTILKRRIGDPIQQAQEKKLKEIDTALIDPYKIAWDNIESNVYGTWYEVGFPQNAEYYSLEFHYTPGGYKYLTYTVYCTDNLELVSYIDKLHNDSTHYDS